EYVEKIELASLGRRLVTLAKQSLNQKIRELEKDIVYNEYKELLGEIVVGEIYQIRKNDILVNHNKNELVLPRNEQIPFEKYKKGETIRAIVKEVKKTSSGPVIIISRADNLFLQRLFEIEVPEIYDGIIEIKSIAREPGERAKVAVESTDNRIDAVGACVGMKGVRIHAIVRELNNENIDVIHYSDDPAVFIQRALAPAKLKSIEINEDEKKAVVTADSDQVSMIVGRNGVNIRLAMKLTGYEIEIIREEKPFEEYEEDIELIDLKDELGADVYEILINNRYDTALEVLKAGPEKLKEIKEFDDEKIEEILEIIKSQFEEEE
ncbi:MAG: transcription termination factor NusA, partial [Ignavibacterium sp.]